MLNRYFIVDIPNVNFENVFNIVVQSPDSVRRSVDGTKAIVKLPVGNKSNYGFLGQEYTHEQILIETNKPEWNMTINQVIAKVTQMSPSQIDSLVVDVEGTAGWLIDKKTSTTSLPGSQYNDVVTTMRGYNADQENLVYDGLVVEDVNIIRPTHHPVGG